jgi:hypothetical protein
LELIELDEDGARGVGELPAAYAKEGVVAAGAKAPWRCLPKERHDARRRASE